MELKVRSILELENAGPRPMFRAGCDALVIPACWLGADETQLWVRLLQRKRQHPCKEFYSLLCISLGM